MTEATDRWVVCGYPRGGTTLFYNMLRTTLVGFETYERERPASWGAPPCVTKRPMDIVNANAIKQHFPSARFLVMVRDPRSVMTSRHWNVPDDYFIGWRGSYISPLNGMKIKDGHPGIMEISRSIRGCPSPICLKYEDLVNHPDEVQQNLADVCGFEFSGKFSEFHKHDIPEHLEKALNGVRPPDPSSITKWKDHPERVRQQFEECPALFDLLIEYGYERDKEWIKSL